MRYDSMVEKIRAQIRLKEKMDAEKPVVNLKPYDVFVPRATPAMTLDADHLVYNGSGGWKGGKSFAAGDPRPGSLMALRNGEIFYVPVKWGQELIREFYADIARGRFSEEEAVKIWRNIKAARKGEDHA